MLLVAVFASIGGRSALALTTVDYRTVDRDAQRIPDNATGAFYDDFNWPIRGVHSGRPGRQVDRHEHEFHRRKHRGH